MAEEVQNAASAFSEATDEAYPALAGVKWIAIVGAGRIGLRFGPFEGAAMGKIMMRCMDEGIPLSIVAECGSEFDWDLARGLAGGADAPLPSAEGADPA